MEVTLSEAPKYEASFCLPLKRFFFFYYPDQLNFTFCHYSLQQSAENSGSSTSSSGSNYGTLGRGGMGSMASMMDEMAKTLARRRAAAEKKDLNDEVSEIIFI